MLAALASDPDADVDAIVKKFCAARYGNFADEARTALLTLEDITRNTCSIPNSSLKSADQIEADPERLHRRQRVPLGARMDQRAGHGARRGDRRRARTRLGRGWALEHPG